MPLAQWLDSKGTKPQFLPLLTCAEGNSVALWAIAVSWGMP